MKKLVINALSVLLAASLCFAQGTPEGEPAVKFSSVYTDLKTQCKSALTKKEEKESEERGEDTPMICKGYGGYEIFLSSHGAMTQFTVRLKTGEKEVAAQEVMYINDPIYTRKVEWRLADGVPFAVIYRRDVNEETEDVAIKNKIGEVLRVVGLKDKKIDFEVDVKKTPNPNEEARRLADRAYAGPR